MHKCLFLAVQFPRINPKFCRHSSLFFFCTAFSDCGIFVIYDPSLVDEKLARELVKLSQNTQGF